MKNEKQPQKMQRTEGKWEANGLTISSFGFGVVAKCILPKDGGCIHAVNNAGFIAKAANMHNELTEALHLAKWYAMQYYGEISNSESEAIKNQNTSEDYQKILLLIKQAE